MDMKGINGKRWERINTNFFENKASWQDTNNDKKIQTDEIRIGNSTITKDQSAKLLQYYQILISSQKNNTFPELIMTLKDPDVVKAMETCNLSENNIKVGRVPLKLFSNKAYYLDNKEGTDIIVIDNLSTDMEKLKKDLLDACQEIMELKNTK